MDRNEFSGVCFRYPVLPGLLPKKGDQRAHFSLETQAGWAADEGIAALVEAEQAMCCAGDPDALADAEALVAGQLSKPGVAYRTERAEPERARGAQIDAVKATVD